LLNRLDPARKRSERSEESESYLARYFTGEEADRLAVGR
jgi:hypothetical protein